MNIKFYWLRYIAFFFFFKPCVQLNESCNVGGPSLIPGSGRSPREGNGNPLQYFCLENPRDRGAWQATVHWVTRVRNNLVTQPPPVE